MLLFQNALRERLLRVVRLNRNTRLQNDGARIDPLIHEMDRAPAHPRAVLHCLALGVIARECREQCRVNVQDPVPVLLQHRSTQEALVPGQAHPFHIVPAQDHHQCPFVFVAARIFTLIDDRGGDARLPGAHQAVRLLVIAQDHGHVRRIIRLRAGGEKG